MSGKAGLVFSFSFSHFLMLEQGKEMKYERCKAKSQSDAGESERESEGRKPTSKQYHKKDQK
jgi:hypothetical protein